MVLNHGDPGTNVQWCRTGPYTGTQRYASVKHSEPVARLSSRRSTCRAVGVIEYPRTSPFGLHVRRNDK